MLTKLACIAPLQTIREGRDKKNLGRGEDRRNGSQRWKVAPKVS